MMKTLIYYLVTFATIFLGAGSVFGHGFTISGDGNNAVFDGTIDEPSISAIAADSLLTGAAIFDFQVTTGSDILLFDAEITETPGMNVPGGWYNQTNIGVDTELAPLFLIFAPQMTADAWITTPGNTAAAGANTLNGPPGMRLVTHNDSTDDGPQTDFTFARFSLIPDANGNAFATLRGTLQTASQPRPIFDDFEANFFLGFNRFRDGVPLLLNTTDTVDDFFTANGVDPSMVAADDVSRYPDGVTLFVPTDAAIAASDWTYELDSLFVVDDGVSTGLTDSDSPGWSLGDLTNLVPETGDSFEVTTMNGAPRTISNGSVMFDGATIIASHQTENGWIHILDTVPVPEPSSSALLITALVGLSLLRRKHRLLSPLRG